jgi:FKBP-type peptidyl-prolyl cis-trans isomerase FkpA
MRFYLLLTVFAALLAACNKDQKTDEEILRDDIAEIEADLAQKNLTAQSTASGLHYIITEPGSSEHPALQHDVTVRYKGQLLDGTVFDQTDPGQSVTFPLSNLITGWQEAIPLLGKGGKGTFWLPSALGYGRQGTSGIPPNAVLIFEIELVDFN